MYENMSKCFDKFHSGKPTDIKIANETERGLIYGKEFENVILSCSVKSGVPEEHMVWIQDNRVIEKGGPGKINYSLNATMSHHAVKYSCEALDNNNRTLLERTVQIYIFSK